MQDGTERTLGLSVSDAGREPIAGGGISEAVCLPSATVCVEAVTVDRTGRSDPIASVEGEDHEATRDH